MSSSSKKKSGPGHELEAAKKLHVSGKFAEAERGYRAILKENPDHGVALRLLGGLLLQVHRYADAADVLEKVIALGADDPDTHFNLALSYYHRDMLSEAIDRFGTVTQLDPDHAASYYMMGRAVLKQFPDDHRWAYSLFAKDASLSGRVDAHVLAAQQAIFVEAWEAGCEHARAALTSDPENVEAIYALARALLGNTFKLNQVDIQQVEAVIKLASILIRMAPQDARGYALTGDALCILHQDDLALDFWRQSLDRDPDQKVIRTNRAIILLRNRQLSEGWREIAHRSYASEKLGMFDKQLDVCPAPRWQGQVYAGAHLLVFGEQGIGDQLLHAQMVPELMAAGMKVGFVVADKMQALMQRSLPGADIYASSTGVPEDIQVAADFKCDLLELGLYLRADLPTLPPPVRFLQPRADLVAHFTDKYSIFGNVLKVGISWRSSSRTTGVTKSSMLGEWAPILSVPGVKFFNVQYGDFEDELADAEQRFGIDVYREDFNTFDDIERAVAQATCLDLVISVSNAGVHMAAQVGTPVWVLLATRPLWHWFIDGESSVWYDSVTLIRQRELEGWSSVINETGRRLQALVVNGHAS